MIEIREGRAFQQFETLYKQKLGKYEKCCDNIHKIAKSLFYCLTTSNQVTEVSNKIERRIPGRKKRNGEKELNFSHFF
uniref:Transposase n=1 Tax=Strongyloides venezuelensis TaxID=75913 RepID=A0A0K0FQW1_STRVS